MDLYQKSEWRARALASLALASLAHVLMDMLLSLVIVQKGINMALICCLPVKMYRMKRFYGYIRLKTCKRTKQKRLLSVQGSVT